MSPTPNKSVSSKKVAAKSANNTSSRRRNQTNRNASASNPSVSNNRPAVGEATANANAVNSISNSNNMNAPRAQGNNNEDLLAYLRANSAPLGNNIRISGSPGRMSNGPRRAIIIVQILNKEGGIHGYLYGFRREEDPSNGSYVEKIHRDQVRGRDSYLMNPPLNVLKMVPGYHENGEPRLNDKGYELSAFVSLQNFQGKTEQEVRQLGRFFAAAIKHHIEQDPNCANQVIVVNDDNIHYNEDSVFMDFIGERNAVNLYRTILPVDSTPGYSQYNAAHARSFFREGTLSPESVALIKSDDTFLAPGFRNENAGRDEEAAQNAEDANENGQEGAEG